MAAACGVRLDGDQPPGPDANQPNPDAPGGPDATDGPPALGPWGMPALVAGASNTTLVEDDGTLSSTTLELVFSVVDATAGKKDLWTMKRTSVTAAWGPPSKLGFDTTTYSEETPRFSDDDLTLYFASDRLGGGPGLLDIYKSTRTAVGGTWTTPVLVPGVSTTLNDKWFMPCSGTSSYMMVFGASLGQGTLGSQPTASTPLNAAAPATQTGTFLSQDCKSIYFASNRSGTSKLYVATRASATGVWDPPQEVTTFAGTGGGQEDPWLSADQRTFVFASDVTGTKDIYISTR